MHATQKILLENDGLHGYESNVRKRNENETETERQEE